MLFGLHFEDCEVPTICIVFAGGYQGGATVTTKMRCSSDTKKSKYNLSNPVNVFLFPSSSQAS